MNEFDGPTKRVYVIQIIKCLFSFKNLNLFFTMTERSRRLIQVATLGKYAEHIFSQGLGIFKMNPYYMLLLIAHIQLFQW